MSSASRPEAWTIGFFDGVHRGHQRLLGEVAAAAEARGLRPGAVTFDLHSLEVVHRKGPLATLLTTDEKVAALREAGMAGVEVVHFTPEFAAQSGEWFVEKYLISRLGARYLAVGRDFRFGRGRGWGADEMQAIAAQHGVETGIIDLIGEDGKKISSRDIRRLLGEGEVGPAAVLLGRPYRLTGTVIDGQKLGRTLGFPTANLALPDRKFIPRQGIYAVRVAVGADSYSGAMSIGLRPTVGGQHETYEVHLLDFDGDLYGQTISVDLIAWLREELHFDGLPALQAQMQADCDQARAILAVADLP